MRHNSILNVLHGWALLNSVFWTSHLSLAVWTNIFLGSYQLWAPDNMAFCVSIHHYHVTISCHPWGHRAITFTEYLFPSPNICWKLETYPLKNKYDKTEKKIAYTLCHSQTVVTSIIRVWNKFNHDFIKEKNFKWQMIWWYVSRWSRERIFGTHNTSDSTLHISGHTYMTKDSKCACEVHSSICLWFLYYISMWEKFLMMYMRKCWGSSC